MNHILFVERNLSEDELEHIFLGFKHDEIFRSQIHQISERSGFVALDGKKLIGCSTGLAYKNGEEYNGWFYLTDLFVEKEYRGKGNGKILLKMLEEKLFSFGIRKIWLFTAGFEAPEFYKKQGYEIFVEFEDYYNSFKAFDKKIMKLEKTNAPKEI